MKFILIGGQAADIDQADGLLRDVAPDAVIADKGYDADALVQVPAEHGIETVIPPRSSRTTPRPYNWFL